jgi:hyperosmotically inducible protein
MGIMKRFGGTAIVAALATSALVALGGCSSTQSTGEIIDDASITASVKAKLAGDPEVSAHEIDVDTVDGRVTLTGAVDSAAERAEAVRLAQETDGVEGVTDNLTVGGSPSLGEHVDDAGITASVKAKLADDPMVKARNIDVDVNQGVVTLTGKVQTEAERMRAEQIAQSASGVKSVTNNLEVAVG